MRDLENFRKLLDDEQGISPSAQRDFFFQYLLEQGYYTVMKTIMAAKVAEEKPIKMVKETDVIETEQETVIIKVPSYEIKHALKDTMYSQEFFEQKFLIDYNVIKDYVYALGNLNESEASYKKFKQSIIAIFKNKMPLNEAEFKANLYFMADIFRAPEFEIVRLQKYVKMSEEARKERGRVIK